MTAKITTGAAQDITCAASARAPWTVLVAASQRAVEPREPRLKTALIQVVAAGLVVIALVAIVGAAISRHTAENQSVHEVAQLTNVLAEGVVQPALTDAMATSTTAAAALDPILRSPDVFTGSLVRIKIWTPAGRIVYSDERRLIGLQFGLDAGARAALGDPQVRAELSDLTEPENRYERGNGTMLEVYRPVWTPSGRPLLFETYFRYNEVSDRASDLWRGFAGITLSSIAAVVVLLVPLVWTLVGRARRAQRLRAAALERAMAASQDERRRIAATLHDGVVQELAGTSFALAGAARDAGARGDATLAAQLAEAGEAVRSSMGGMRALLVDIYPASLRESGLDAALRDLAGTVRTEVVCTVDSEAATALSPAQQEAMFRFAQECLRNAAKHAAAHRVTLTLSRNGSDVVLVVVDDGVGFDVAGERPESHFGLSLLADLAREHGGELAVRTAPGAGTAWRLRLTP